jgi:hypothetical protein
MVNQSPVEVPFGLCQCGCGERTRIAPVNDRSKGWVKGEPVKFKRGHHLCLDNRRGPASSRWKGGRYIAPNGYVMLTLESGERNYEHIVVAERVLGRPLKFFGTGHPDNEVVHHVRANKQNNGNGNLLICTHAYHTALHHRLEQSSNWPEFPPVVRRGSGGQK